MTTGSLAHTHSSLMWFGDFDKKKKKKKTFQVIFHTKAKVEDMKYIFA